MNKYFVNKIANLRKNLPEVIGDPLLLVRKLMRNRNCSFSLKAVSPDTIAEIMAALGVGGAALGNTEQLNSFVGDMSGEKAAEVDGLKFVPILTAIPSDKVRDGPYVYPKGPYPHIQASKGRAEAMMWTVERPDGGRGFGFTGGHFHDNWKNDNYRRVVLNAILWIAKVNVPEGGVESTVSKEQLNANLDPKNRR